MKSLIKEFVKSVTVHRSAEFICVEPLSGVNGLRYREDENHRVYLNPDATEDALGGALLAALDKSRFIGSEEREFFNRDRAMRVYENWQKDFVARYGCNSRREAYANMD